MLTASRDIAVPESASTLSEIARLSPIIDCANVSQSFER